jgi:hypothetical protein
MGKGTKISKVNNSEANLNEVQREWWAELKEVDIELYGLPDQKIGQIASPINMEPERLHLSVKAPAGIPAIEAALQKFCDVDMEAKVKYPKYAIAIEDRFLVIKPMEGQIVKGPTGKAVFVQKK